MLVNAERELFLIRLAQLGSQSAVSDLLRHFKAFIWRIVRKHGRRSLMDDHYQDACIEFVNAIMRFDVASGHRLAAFSRWFVVGAVRRGQHSDRIIHIPRNAVYSSPSVSSLCDSLSSASSLPSFDRHDVLDLYAAVSKLCDRDQLYFSMRFIRELSHREIDVHFGFSRWSCRHEKRVLSSLRNLLRVDLSSS